MAYEPSKTTFSFWQGLIRSDVNPVNNKSRTLPLLNPIDKYGRTFHMSWFGFMVAFLSWFSYPPLLHQIIKSDLKLTSAQIGNSNIIGLIATLFMRLIVGPLSDRYGSRRVMAGVLIAGAIPTALTPLVKSGQAGVSGLYAMRFFIGVLGSTFVPCVTWTTQFFDKSIVGRANGLAAGWGNAGGGITFFVMTSVQSALMGDGYSLSKSWKYAFVVLPFPVLMVTAITILVFGHDTPTGPWRTRHLHAGGKAVDTNALDRSLSGGHDKTYAMTDGQSVGSHSAGSSSPPRIADAPGAEKKASPDIERADEQIGTVEELPVEPTIKDTLKVFIHPQVLYLALNYMCSFGSELAIEGALSAIYAQRAKVIDKKTWTDHYAGDWAAMFGLLNIVMRPLGGYIADKLFLATGSVASKKWWNTFLNLFQGAMFIAAGLTPHLNVHHLITLTAFISIPLCAANGANFAITPHVLPHRNGVVSGIVGASGNLGGIIGAIVFRFHGTNYNKSLWIIGTYILAVTLATSWIKMPKK